MKEFDGFRRTGTDAKIEDMIYEHCKKHQIDSLDSVNLFPVLARRHRLKRFLAHTELFKLTLDVPGDIAELGVFRGLGLMTWANLLEAYSIGNRTKTVYGFDNWQGFTQISKEDEAEDLDSQDAQKKVGGFSPKNYFGELQDAITIYDADRFIPWKPRIKLVCGNIEDTIPEFVQKNPGVRFSLIHFDCDLYQPTRVALNHFWTLLSRGGVMLFDEYSIPAWPGETKAVDEFFADKPDIKIKNFSWTNSPSGYIIKP